MKTHSGSAYQIKALVALPGVPFLVQGDSADRSEAIKPDQSIFSL